MISMDKKYRTRDGRDVRLLCTDGPGAYPVVGFLGGALITWTREGLYANSSYPEQRDLIEVRSAEDVVREAIDVRLSHGYSPCLVGEVSRMAVSALRESGHLKDES